MSEVIDLADLPRSAKSLAIKAQSHGWAAEARRAVAPDFDDLESHVLRLAHRGGVVRAVGLWEAGRFKFAWLWASWAPLQKIGARALSKVVAGEDPGLQRNPGVAA